MNTHTPNHTRRRAIRVILGVAQLIVGLDATLRDRAAPLRGPL